MLDIKHGVKIHASGSLVGSGLSSSASVGLVYLKEFADVTDIRLTNEQLIRLEFELEHNVPGLQIGLIDPMTIVNGRKDVFLFIS